MQNDKITLKDLSVFSSEPAGNIFALLDYTITQKGREVLRAHIIKPPASYRQLQDVQETVKYWTINLQNLPPVISNGTLVMLERFFETADNTSSPPSPVNTIFGSFFQKLFNKDSYSFTQFSLSHLSDFLKGCYQLVSLLENGAIPQLLAKELQNMQKELEQELMRDLLSINKNTPFRDIARLSFRVRREIKTNIYNLINSYAKVDCWQSIARATNEHKWNFPSLLPADILQFEAHGLYHPLLKQPVSYDIQLGKNKNLLLLTGANMSGKTTFMRSMGVAALLAHIGAGVPAQSLEISFLEGIISNMQVEDNLLLGESYFFAEVQRMKLIAEKLQQPGSCIVLMDELFKGTNVHDAFECTRAVTEGLLHHSRHIIVLSTHLHEVVRHFENNKGIIFKYFVTNMGQEGTYQFTYQLKNGISDDRIGYRILQKEGVIDLLKNG